MKKRAVKKRSNPRPAKKTAFKKKPSKKKRSSGSRKSFKINPIAPGLASDSRPKGFDFPASYGQTCLTLMARDPWWIYAYWEITPKKEREVLEKMSSQGVRRGARRALRIYRQISFSEAPFFDIEIGDFADNWYVEVGVPGELWVAEIGLRSQGGRFYPLVRSNAVRTPRYGISDEIDPEWRLPQDVWDRLFEASGVSLDSKSSFDLARNSVTEENKD